MQTVTAPRPHQTVDTGSGAPQPCHYSSLERETRSHVETACAAFHLNRKPQTLRSWACLENGPIRPRRINGRLVWAVVDIKALLEGSAA